MKYGKKIPLGLTLAIFVSPAAHAELILLEQFEYEGTDAPLSGSDGGTGFEGPWAVTGWSRNFDIGRTNFAPGNPGSTVNATGGLEFEGHPSAGTALSRYGTAGQREASRQLTAESQAALTTDNSTIWFSLLASAPNNNRYGTMIFGTDILTAVQGSATNGNLSSETGQAFGVGFRTDNGGLPGGGTGSPNAVAFKNSASATVEVGTYESPLQEGATHHDTSLIVGKINWKADGTPDELYLFNIAPGGQTEPIEGDAVASLTADFDQSNFKLISLQDTGATIFDEIRFGTTFGDVVPGAGPSVPLLITDIGYSAIEDEVTLTWNSRPGVAYTVRYSTDLIDWTGDLDDGVLPDEGNSTTRTFGLAGVTDGSEKRVFFRVHEEQ